MGLIKSTLQQEGIPTNDKGDYLPMEGQEELFKLYLANPEKAYEIQKYLQKDENDDVVEFSEKIPRLVRTMALGSLTLNEVKATRHILDLANMAYRRGYVETAIHWYTKVVQLNVTSQPYMGNMLRQLLIHSVGIQRTESVQSEHADRNSSDEPSLFDKIKDKVKSGGSGSRPALGMGTPPAGISGGGGAPFFRD